MEYDKLLNPQQLEPVYDTEGPVLVLAGAGSGKTRVLTHRIAYLIEEKHVYPYNILAITFTNKAANEMKERVEALTGQAGVFISTFHSFCAYILRNEIHHFEGYNKNFSIYDDTDSKNLINHIVKDLGYDMEDDDKKSIRSHISRAKNNALNPEEYSKRMKGEANEPVIHQIYSEYEKRLKTNNAVDFDDLLVLVLKLFVNHKDVLEKYQDRFQYIHVDEFQDTNKVQYLLVKLLGNKYMNVFAVGDDDQSIYGWRYAEVANIRNFKEHFLGCRLYKLEQNYRSTKPILDMANRIIQNNDDRMSKTLWTASEGGDKIEYYCAYDDRDEARWVIQKINALIRTEGYSYKDFAILSRVNSLTRNFEDQLRDYNMPYKVIGGNKFYDRKEVKDFMAYLKMMSNHDDAESILRIINVPKRGIGDAAVQSLRDECIATGLSLYDAIKIVDQLNITNANKNKLAKFRDLVLELERLLDNPLPVFVDEACKAIHFETMYDPEVQDDRNKLDNIDGVVTSISTFVEHNQGATLDDFLQSVSLDMSLDKDEDNTDNAVTLATIHGVKGLEYKVVFIVGLEEGLFPSTRKNTTSDILEERRIMYVAVTRAQKRLYLSCASRRYLYGHVDDSRIVSRFVSESGAIIPRPKEQYKKENLYPGLKFGYQKPNTPMFNSPQNRAAESVDMSKFKVGMKVKHGRYGEGVIVELSSENAKISFPKLGVKTFNMRLAPITIIE